MTGLLLYPISMIMGEHGLSLYFTELGTWHLQKK